MSTKEKKTDSGKGTSEIKTIVSKLSVPENFNKMPSSEQRRI